MFPRCWCGFPKPVKSRVKFITTHGTTEKCKVSGTYRILSDYIWIDRNWSSTVKYISISRGIFSLWEMLLSLFSSSSSYENKKITRAVLPLVLTMYTHIQRHYMHATQSSKVFSILSLKCFSSKFKVFLCSRNFSFKLDHFISPCFNSQRVV